MRSKVFGPVLAVLLIFGGFAEYGNAQANGWFHPFRHGRSCQNTTVTYPQPYNPTPVNPVSQWYQYGVFKAHFGEDKDCPFHKSRCKSDHWVWGYVNGDGWIYYEKEVPDPFHPGVTTDVEQVFKDLENDIFNIFHKHKSRLVGPTPKTETEVKAEAKAE